MSQPASRRSRGGGGLDWLAREGGGDAGAVVREQLLALTAPPTAGERVEELGHDRIDPSPYQARRVFPAGPMEELTESIRLHGLLQPIVVRPRQGNRFELVAGERRWRAVGRLGWDRVPAVVRNVDDLAAHLLGQIENDDREDISAWERALGYVNLRAHLQQERGSLPTLSDLGAIRGVDKSTVSRYLAVGDAFPPELVRAAGIAEEDVARLALPILLRAARKPEPERFALLQAALQRGRSLRPRTGPLAQGAEWEDAGVHASALDEGVVNDAPRPIPSWERYFTERSIRVETASPARELAPEQARGAIERIVPAIAALSAQAALATRPAALLATGDGGRLVFVPDPLSDQQAAALERLVRLLTPVGGR